MPTIQWRGFDPPGTESCEISERRTGWRFVGRAVTTGDWPARLSYAISLSSHWVTRAVRIIGTVGEDVIDLTITRSSAGHWAMNGTPHPALEGANDIDLGFSPATNTCAIRRLGPALDTARATTAAWLDPTDWALKPLRQTYTQTGPNTWAYRSPTTGYSTQLTVNNDGFVTDYPGLWVAVPQGGAG
ncbi:MAG: putative glycolipid-binding domain-containing protein [Pseudomonadota bacterium]